MHIYIYDYLFPSLSQSFGTDELYLESKSLSDLTEKDSDPSHPQQQTATSEEGTALKKITSLTKKEEEWDKEIPEVSIFRVMALNSKEWWLIILGMIGAFMAGCITPLFAIVFGEILEVFALERDQIQSSIALWAGLFLAMGAFSGIGIFLKVHICAWQLFYIYVFFLVEFLLHCCW